MTVPVQPVPSYGLYGDERVPWSEDFFHCETIAARSRPNDWEISPHVHPALAQMLLLAQGTARIRLDGEDRSLSGPLLVIAPAGHVHGFRFSSDVSGHVVTVSRDYAEGLARHDRLRARLAKAEIAVPDPGTIERLLALGAQLVEAERDRFDPDVQRLHRALAEAWLRTACAQPVAGATAGATLAERFQALVEASFREHRPLDYYADRLGCTVRTLSRQTDLAYGMTPRRFVNRRIAFEARRLLRFTNADCGVVGAELGFDDPAYFARFYRRMTGRSPSEEKRGRC